MRSYLETVFAWGAGDLDVRMPGAADGNAFFARFDADIEAAATAARTAAVFSHGAAYVRWNERARQHGSGGADRFARGRLDARLVDRRVGRLISLRSRVPSPAAPSEAQARGRQ